MAITQVGSTLTFTGGSANTGTVSSTITVPAGTDLVVGGWTGYSSTANFFSTGSMTFTKGGADTAMTNVSGGDSNTAAFMCAMFYMVNPDVGSNKAWKWDWAGAAAASDPSTVCSLTFWQGVDTASPLRGSAGTQASGLPYTTGTITAASGDLIIAYAGFFCNSLEGSINTWSNLSTLSQIARGGDADATWGTGSPSGNTTVAASTGTNVNDGGIIAAAFKAAAATSDTFLNQIRLYI